MKRILSLFLLAAFAVSSPVPIRADAVYKRGAGAQMDPVVPGLSLSGICDETCQRWLENNLLSVRGATDALPIFHFNVDTGADTNPCTAELPCQTLGKMNEIIQHGPARLRLTGDWDTTAEWGGAAEAGHGSTSGTDYTNTAFFFPTDICPTTLSPCWIIESADLTGATPATIDCAGHDATVGGGLATGDGTVLFIGNTEMDAVFSGIDIVGCPVASDTADDIFRMQTGTTNVHVWAVNVGVPDLHNTNNQMYTDHGAGGNSFSVINSNCRIIAGDTNTTQQCIWMLGTGTSYTTVFNTEFEDQSSYNGANGDTELINTNNGTDSYWTILRNSFIRTGTASSAGTGHSAIGLAGNVSDNKTQILFIGLNTFRGFVDSTPSQVGAIRLTNAGTHPSTVQTHLYRNTFGDSRRGLQLINTSASSDIDFIGSCNLFSGVTYKMIDEQTANCAAIDYNLTQNVWDNSIQTNQPAILKTVTKATMQAFEDDSAAAGCNGGSGYTNVYGATDFNSPAATEYAQASQLLVANDADAFQSCTTGYTHIMQPEEYWPTWLTGASVEIKGFSFSADTSPNIGAK